MNKLEYAIYAIFFCVLFAFYYFLFPETILNQELEDLFLWDRGFLRTALGNAPGLTSLFTAYLLQLFRWLIWGAFLMALVPTLTACLFRLLCEKPGQRCTPWGLLLSLGLFLVAPFNLNLYLQGLFFVLLTGWGLWLLHGACSLCHRAVQWACLLAFMLSSVVGFFLLSFFLVALSVVFCVVCCMMDKSKERLDKIQCAIAGFLAIVALLLVQQFCSDHLNYIPLDNRYFAVVAGTKESHWVLCAFIVPLLLKNFNVSQKRWIGWGVLCVIACLLVVCPLRWTKDKETQSRERIYLLSKLTEQKNFKRILEEVSTEEYNTNPLFLMYVLLAEAQTHELANRLFTYPVFSSDAFCYKVPRTKPKINFNRQFYENLGIFDESYHQALEQSVAMPYNMSFSTLRYLVRYTPLIGHKEEARHYMDILAASTFHRDWIASEEKFVERCKILPIDTPEVANTYIGYYPMELEMQSQLEAGVVDRAVLDYALLGNLLEHKLGHFVQLLHQYPYYKGVPLPRAYAEALAMIAHTKDGALVSDFVWPREYNIQFEQFAQAEEKDDKEALAKFKGTYWWYFHKTSQVQMRRSD